MMMMTTTMMMMKMAQVNHKLTHIYDRTSLCTHKYDSERWLGGVTMGHRSLDQMVSGLVPGQLCQVTTLCSYSTHVPLLPSSINLCWQKLGSNRQLRTTSTPLVINMELIVISRILIRNFGYSCVTLCHVDSRKYFSPYLQDGCSVLCCEILWPCED